MFDKKKQLFDLVKQYVDGNNCVDISSFRNEHPSAYALIPHYFGGISQMIEKNGWIKVVNSKGKKGEKPTLRNQLAFDHLIALRKHLTLDQIATKYNVSRQAVNQLFKALENNLSDEDED